MQRRLACRILAAWPLAAAAQQQPGTRPALRIAAAWKDPTSWIAARLLEQLYQQCEQPLRIAPLPPSRASMEMNQGQVDGELVRVAAYAQGNPNLLRVEPSYYGIQVQGFSLPARSVNLRSVQDLQHYSVGGVRGVLYVQELTDSHPNVTLAQTAQQMFRMLQAGRIDVALIGRIAGRYAAERVGLREVLSSPDLARYELFHYLHVRHRRFAESLGSVIARQRSSGELARMTAALEAQVMAIDVDTAFVSEQG